MTDCVDDDRASSCAFRVVTGHPPSVLVHTLLDADLDDDYALSNAIAAMGSVTH